MDRVRVQKIARHLMERTLISLFGLVGSFKEGAARRRLEETAAATLALAMVILTSILLPLSS